MSSESQRKLGVVIALAVFADTKSLRISHLKVARSRENERVGTGLLTAVVKDPRLPAGSLDTAPSVLKCRLYEVLEEDHKCCQECRSEPHRCC